MDSGENLSFYMRILARRWWLVLFLVVAAGGTTAFQLSMEPPTYAAVTRVRITAPEPGEVAIYTPLGRADVRKEVEYVKNDFVETASGMDTAWRTADALKREVDGSYVQSHIKILSSYDTDYVSIVARAHTADLAQRLADAHTRESLAYFGEIRAKPITGVIEFLEAEMTRSMKDINDANRDLQGFRNEHKIGSLDDEIASYRSLITSLRTERDVSLGRGDRPMSERFDQIIRSHEEKLTSLIALTSEYRSLTSRVNELESAYGRLLSKQTEAKLKAEQSRNVGFIQMVEPARRPTEPTSTNLINFVIMSIVAAILLGSMLSFLIEYLSVPSPRRAREGNEAEPQPFVAG